VTKKMLTLMYPITQDSLDEWSKAVITECDGDTEGNTTGYILEYLDKTIEELADVYLEDYREVTVPVPEDATGFSIKALAAYGFGEFDVVEIGAYKDSQGNVYADLDDLC
jgi:hypothetical protein